MTKQEGHRWWYFPDKATNGALSQPEHAQGLREIGEPANRGCLQVLLLPGDLYHRTALSRGSRRGDRVTDSVEGLQKALGF